MLFVPGGSFAMGTDETKGAQQPAHEVKVDASCLDRPEVTVAA